MSIEIGQSTTSTGGEENVDYACLTVHYVSVDWELKKKILAYKIIEYPHDGETLFKFVKQLILEWNIDKKMFCIVVDNASNNDVMVRLLKEWLNEQGLLYLDGRLFHVRCSAYILNLIVQDGLKLIGGLLSKVRESVRYLSRSTFAKQKFDLVVSQVKLQGKKSVPMDVPNRWNSTYLMLETALEFKEAFYRLAQTDTSYKHNPSQEEWAVAKLVSECLKVFYDATCRFSGTTFPTSNIFFPDICQIQLHLKEWKNSEHGCLQLMANPMCEKFEKYWENCCLVLAIAVVLDPRYKMEMVRYYYEMIYGDEAARHIGRVHFAFIDLYNEYKGDISLSLGSSQSSAAQLLASSSGQRFSGFYQYLQDKSSSISVSQKSELDLYLEDLVFPDDDEKFEILQWWKTNSDKFPTLARMARDILAVPATTIASEAAFSIGGRVIDETRSSLHPEIVETLVVGNDWIESRKT